MRFKHGSYVPRERTIRPQSRYFRFVSRFAAFSLALALLGVITGGVYLTVKPPAAASSLTAVTKSLHVKKLRAIVHHNSKHVCGTTKKGRVRCLAEISVGSTGKPLTGSPDNSGSYGPEQFHTAYNLPCTPGGSVASTCSTPSSFGPETVAIVDAGNFSSGTSGLNTSLQTYDQLYSLPACSTSNGCLNVVNQTGSSSSLPPDAGWSDEIALDVETAHMVCQTCKILLVEATNNSASNLAASVTEAATFDPVAISNSWGTSTDVTSLDADFDLPGIAVVASTGDNGSVSSGEAWPADNPNVVAAAGTTLQLNYDDTWASESVWSSSGGGCSDRYTAPSWQSSRSDWSSNGCGSYRAFGDVSADADPSTGAAISIGTSWYEIGGTSLSAPLVASMFALAKGVASGTTASSVPYAAFKSSNSHDISNGSDCTGTHTTHCTASTGFDTPSGLGSPNGISGFISLPTQPSLTAETVDQNHVHLSWTASSAIDGIGGYHIYRGGSEIATVSTTSYSDSGLTPNTNYSYDVVAYDTAGDLSQPSSSQTAFTAYPEDINEDTHIDLLDLSLLASKYGQSGASVGRADINGDGKVDLLDLSLLASKYGSE